jgi:3-oxoacid CoA-transferase subunit B
MLTREQIAARVARELTDGASVCIDASWADLIRAALPAGVTVREPAEGEVDYAVIGTEAVTGTGSFAGSQLGRKAQRVIAIVAQHQGNDGSSRILKQVGADVTSGQAQRVFTDLAVFDVTPEGLVLREVAPNVSALDVQLKSDTPLLASDELKVISV